MLTILELDDNLIYVESEWWQCDFGLVSPVKLGLILEAVNLGGSFSFVIEACLMPQPEYIDPEIVSEARETGISSREDLIKEVYLEYGGVPVNIDAVQPAKASCGFSSFIADTEISSGNQGSGLEVRHFKDLDDAMKFARDFYAVYAVGLFGFVDMVLDNPLRAGGTGREKIMQMAGKQQS